MPQAVTITSDAYSFDELNDAAKERARNWYREGDMNEFDFDCTIEDFTTICDIIGIELEVHAVKLMSGKTRTEPNVYYSVGYCQSDYAAFEGAYDYKATAGAKLREHAPQDSELHRIVDQLAAIQIANGFGLRATIKYTDYYGFSITVEDRRNEERDDELLSTADRDITELVKDLARWLYDQLRSEADYRSSDEAVDENIEANEYMFDKEGNRHAYA